MTNGENLDYNVFVGFCNSVTNDLDRKITTCYRKLKKLNIDIGSADIQNINLIIKQRIKLEKLLLKLIKRKRFWKRYKKLLAEYAAMGRKNIEILMKMLQERYMQQMLMEYLKTRKSEAEKIVSTLFSKIQQRIPILLQANDSYIKKIQELPFQRSTFMEEILSVFELDKQVLIKEYEIAKILGNFILNMGISIDTNGNYDFSNDNAKYVGNELLEIFRQVIAMHAELETIHNEQGSRIATLENGRENIDQTYLDLKKHWDVNKHINNNKSLLFKFGSLLQEITKLETIYIQQSYSDKKTVHSPKLMHAFTNATRKEPDPKSKTTLKPTPKDGSAKK